MQKKILNVFLILCMFLVFIMPIHASTLDILTKQVEDLSNNVTSLQTYMFELILNNLEIQIKELNDNLKNIQSKLNDSKSNNIKSGINSSGGSEKISKTNNLVDQEVFSKEVDTVLAFAVGDSYGGGKIVYVDPSGRHGLIASLVDQCTIVFPGVLPNIPEVCYPNESVALYNNTNATGYNDWRVPSQDELEKLFINRSLIGLNKIGDDGNGNFSNVVMYWSLTPSPDSPSEIMVGLVNPDYSGDTMIWEAHPDGDFANVRAVRSF